MSDHQVARSSRVTPTKTKMLKMSRLKKIEGYENYYISDDGKVFSTKYKESRELSPNKDRRGYLYINLCKNGKYKSKSIHRLVAKHFLDNYSEQLEVNHKDGIKTNNNVSNLEMVTRTENIRHAVKNGLHKSLTCEEHWCSKLTKEDVENIRREYIPGVVTQEVLSEKYGVSRSEISHIINNRYWKNIAG